MSSVTLWLNRNIASAYNALETIRDFDMGIGAPLSFSASEHQASHKVWATVIDKAGNFKVLDMTE